MPRTRRSTPRCRSAICRAWSGSRSLLAAYENHKTDVGAHDRVAHRLALDVQFGERRRRHRAQGVIDELADVRIAGLDGKVDVIAGERARLRGTEDVMSGVQRHAGLLRLAID